MLPKKIIPMGNPDKGYHERWNKKRDMLDFPHPYRAVLISVPNGGKTTVAKNILLRADPPFQRVVVIHCDPEYTQEYDDIDCEMMNKIPEPNEWDGTEKTLCIIDDIEFSKMKNDQLRALSRLFGFVSTHKNVSCIICNQDPFVIPKIVRNCCNIWILWRINDLDRLSIVARRVGMNKDKFMGLFNKYIKNNHDSLWIDRTDKTPYPLRINGYRIIKTRKKRKRNIIEM